MKQVAIGIDLGGTNLMSGAVTAEGNVLAARETRVGDKSLQAIIDLLVREIDFFSREAHGDICGVGLGIPGIVDPQAGIVHQSPHFPDFVNINIRERLQQRVALPLHIDNDVNMFALGEARYGAGKGIPHFVMMTLGTGIGGGIFLDGELVHGERGFAGEIGHIIVEPQGRQCGCGGRGCLELYAASAAFDGESPEKMAELAHAGDAKAVERWNAFGRYLGLGIITTMNVLGITTFIIGGGIADAFDLFAPAVQREAQQRTYAKYAETFRLFQAKLRRVGGIIGAGGACFERGTQNP